MTHFRTAEQVRVEFRVRPRRALVLTTVPHESRAVNAHLVDIEPIAGMSGAIYQMGRYPEPTGDWRVIHAVTQAGNSDASTLATKAHAEFGKFDVLMFVGIAGSLKEDIPIGSVVVGEYVYNSHSGKLDDGGYSSRPHSHPAAYELLKAAQMLALENDWVDLIKAPRNRPLPAIDAYPCPFPPEAFVKSLASVEQVVAGGNNPLYRRIRQYLNDAGAVEMEGWGAMNAAHQEGTSAIIIRGISDMCADKDHQADARYQPIASAHAAAFAFAILSLRSKASPSTSGEQGVVTLATEIGKKVTHAGQRTDYIVNFKGPLSEWSNDQIERVLDGLRRLTGDTNLELVRVTEGSVKLFVRVREGDLSVLTLEAVRAASGERGDWLLGTGTAHELDEAQKLVPALKQASANLLAWERTLPGGGWFERPEKREIEGRFDSEASTSVVLGEPGSGKSSLLAAISTTLFEAEALVLAIKADFLPTFVHNEEDLQGHLRLPSPPSALIERLAKLQPVFLIIDQLDALASQLDLRSDRLNVLLNLVRRVSGIPNVHIVLSARTFEFDHDARLRSIGADAVPLSLPAWHEVNQQLSAAGIDTGSWPENAREVVRNPQALKTYLSLSMRSEDPPFSKYQSMLEQLWRQRVSSSVDSEALTSLASDLAGAMAEEETLWLAASRFDIQGHTLEKLEAIGLIIRSESGQSIAFSHQTVLDYILARSFVREAGRLSSYVLERQDSLFVRSKLWSALRYLRDAEVTSYEREFLEIWRQQGLRRHLRVLLIEFLGELREPYAFEIMCFEEVVSAMDLRAVGLNAISGSPGWFSILARSEIPSAMKGDEGDAKRALKILSNAAVLAPAEVVRLLRENWLPFPGKDSLTWAALDALKTWNGAVEEIALVVLSRTPISAWQVDYTVSMLAIEQPDIALRIVRAKLEFLLKQAGSISTGKPFPADGTEAEKLAWYMTDRPEKPITVMLENIEVNSLAAIAEAEPREFLKVLWPWFRTVFCEIKERQREEGMGSFRFGPSSFELDLDLGDEVSGRRTAEEGLLASLRLAVAGVAKADEEYFTNWVEKNSDLEMVLPQRLIAYGLSAAPGKYSQQALGWLTADSRRLQLGSVSDIRGTTCALIRAVSPNWSSEQIGHFEGSIQSYRPVTPPHITEAEQRKYFNHFIRRSKLDLLAAMPFERLSDRSKALITSERRVLGRGHGVVSPNSEPTLIGSPMEAEAMTKAQDRDILRMFEEVPDKTDWAHPRKWMRGGNIQLSRAFADFAKYSPMRALRIMDEFKPDAQERAAGYALEAIADVGGFDRELQGSLVALHQRGFGVEEFKASAAFALEKIADRLGAVDEELIVMMIEWLKTTRRQEHSGGEKTPEVVGEHEQDQSSNIRRGSILWGNGGIVTLPGGSYPILSGLTSILLRGKKEERERLFSVLNEHLKRGDEPEAWQALLIRLSRAGDCEPELVAQLLRGVFSRYPALLETPEAIYLLAIARRWDVALVFELIAPWENAKSAVLRQAQGELVGLIATERNANSWLALRDELLEHGSRESKIGLAYAGANLFGEPKLRLAAGKLLQCLIPGADQDRMAAILDVFRHSEPLVAEPSTLTLLQALAAPEVDLAGEAQVFMVEKLQSLLPHAAEIIGTIALKVSEAWRSDPLKAGTVAARTAPHLTDLAITLHRLGGPSREVGVTVFEALLDIDAYGTRDTLAEIDGRFVIRSKSARRRIGRRVATGRNGRAV